ncbi:MAG: Uma2 family endonuclease [Leptolyngbyaceae cyanobacterium bins.302]|nr:Uma2 family endonuclease [Leptolyngbyaceae cyanobacterium bins.302]
MQLFGSEIEEAEIGFRLDPPFLVPSASVEAVMDWAKLTYPTDQLRLPSPCQEALSDASPDILPTMYDLPSEDPEEPGLPDEFHDLQPHLLSATVRLTGYSPGEIFTGTDMNVYYDIRHPLWHKRPDWFLVLGVPRLYDKTDLRLSFVVWQERVSPMVAVELLSPGTEDEDMGRTTAEPNAPPTKWQVYEQILRIPYYVIFDRYTNTLVAFMLEDSHYREMELSDSRVWLPTLQCGLGLWYGTFEGITRLWLRWYDADGNWIPTIAEAAQREAETARQEAEISRQEAETARQEAETARQRAEQIAAELEALRQQLRDRGIDPAELAP